MKNGLIYPFKFFFLLCIFGGFKTVTAQQCIDLSLNPQWVNIGDLDVAGNQITVEALVYYRGGVNILSKHTNPSNVNYLLRTGTFELTTTNGFYLMSNPYAGSMQLNTWYHVAGTYDGSFIRYYVNGCLIIEEPATGNLVTNNLAAAIGSQSTNPEQYDGKIDEVRIWNVARSQTDIANNMFNIVNPTLQPGLLGYYKMNNNVLNIQGNATYNGTWVGPPSYDVEPTPAAIPVFDVQNVQAYNSTCLGANNGAIEVAASGSSLQYSLDGVAWQGSNMFTNLPQGQYDIYVQSQEGCVIESQDIDIYELQIPVPPTITLSDDELCLNETIDFETQGLAPGGLHADFNGINSTISGVNYSALANNNFTYEFWVNPNATRLSTIETNTGTLGVGAQPQRFVISPLWGGAVAAFAGVSVGTNGISVIEHGGGFAPIPLVWDAPIVDWVHVAIVYINRTPHLYVDGNLVKTGLQSGRPTVYPCLGSYNIWAAEYFNGSLDNFRVYNYARTQQQIVQDMYLETPTNTAGLIGHLTFNNSTANSTVGISPTANNLSFNAPDYFDYTWSGSAYAPAATTSELQTSLPHLLPGNYNYSLIASHDGCNGYTSVNYPVSVDSPSTNPTGILGAGTYCPGNNVTLALDGGALGTNSNWEWYAGSCGSASIGNGTTISVPTAITETYFVQATASPGCPATPCVSGAVTFPVPSGFLSTHGESSSCTVIENGWVHFYNQASGRLLCAINSNGQNLGAITATSYVQIPPFQVDDCFNPVPNLNTAVLGRRWLINPQFQPVGPVNVRLYYDMNEYTALQGVANSNPNPNDNTATFADLLLSKYHNNVTPALMNDTPFDNCLTGATTLHNPDGSGLANTVLVGFDPNGVYSEYTIPDFSEFWLHASSSNLPLPVELVSFNATCEENGVKIKWQTASENNSEFFSLESSRDGILWSEVKQIQAAGQSNTLKDYEVVDNQISNDITYYRLRQVDYNGQEDLYGPISINCFDELNTFYIYPNPTIGEFNATIVSNDFIQNATISIHDVSGKLILSNDLSIDKGVNTIYFNDFSFAKGTYIMHILTDSGVFKPVRFVIN